MHIAFYITILIHNCNDYVLTYWLYYSCRHNFTDSSSKWQMAPHDCFSLAKVNMEHGAARLPMNQVPLIKSCLDMQSKKTTWHKAGFCMCAFAGCTLDVDRYMGCDCKMVTA